jgi:excisionase family DNA binding protein
VTKPEHKERHAQSQPDLIRTLKSLGIPALWESASFHRNLKTDDFRKVLRMAADIMTIDEVADYLRINKKTAYRLAADSKLPGFKVGGTWRFRRVDIEDWIEREASPKKDKER